MPKPKRPLINEKSERVVVDEIFDDGIARLLRAGRLPGTSDIKDYSIHTWGDEREDFFESWKVEAFVGYHSKMKLKEGDVFFIADGIKLNPKYKPIPRDIARVEHLLIPSDISTGIARTEIKKQFYKLAAVKMSIEEKDTELLIEKIDKKFKDET